MTFDLDFSMPSMSLLSFLNTFSVLIRPVLMFNNSSMYFPYKNMIMDEEIDQQDEMMKYFLLSL